MFCIIFIVYQTTLISCNCWTKLQLISSNADDVLKSQKGSAFKAYDLDEGNKLKTAYCSYECSGAWWKEKNTENCEIPTNLNAFNFEEMLFRGNKTALSRITIILHEEIEHKTLR